MAGTLLPESGVAGMCLSDTAGGAPDSAGSGDYVEPVCVLAAVADFESSDCSSDVV